MAVIAATASSIGGPDSSTAPPGSTVIKLPPGRSGTSAMTAGQLVPVGTAQRVGEVDAVGFDLQADPADRTVGQAAEADPLCGAVGAGQLRFAGVGWVCFIQVGRDGRAGMGHTQPSLSGPGARRLQSIFQMTLTKSRDFRVTRG